MEAIWPDVFIKGEYQYTDKRRAIADGLRGWANCMANVGDIPEKFGDGMVCISKYLGCSAHYD